MSKLTKCHLTGSKSIKLCITQLYNHYVITIMIYLSKFIKTKSQCHNSKNQNMVNFHDFKTPLDQKNKSQLFSL